jgi:hypothetical protein
VQERQAEREKQLWWRAGGRGQLARLPPLIPIPLTHPRTHQLFPPAAAEAQVKPSWEVAATLQGQGWGGVGVELALVVIARAHALLVVPACAAGTARGLGAGGSSLAGYSHDRVGGDEDNVGGSGCDRLAGAAGGDPAVGILRVRGAGSARSAAYCRRPAAAHRGRRARRVCWRRRRRRRPAPSPAPLALGAVQSLAAAVNWDLPGGVLGTTRRTCGGY